MVQTQFSVNKVLVFCVLGVYPYSVVLGSHFLCFDIFKHNAKIGDFIFLVLNLDSYDL
jgi:hypothetical protein